MPRLVLFAGLLALVPACGGPPQTQDAASLGLPIVERSAGATQGAPRAFLGAATGALTITDSKDRAVDAVAGAPLLADDKLLLGPDGLAVIIFTTGNVLRLEGPIDLEVRNLAGFDSAPVGDNLESQLVAALSERDRERLSGANERIGGWQLRLTAIEAPAPEADVRASLPAPDPAPAPTPTPDPDPDPEGPLDDASAGVKTGAGDGYAGKRESQGQGFGHTQGAESKEKDKKNESMPPGVKPAPKADAKPPAKEDKGLDNHPSAEEEHAGDSTEEDDPKSSPSTKDEDDPKLAPLSVTMARWVDSRISVDVPADIRDTLATCLRSLAGTHLVVELTLSSGTIQSGKVLMRTSNCTRSLKGTPFAGTSKSGSIEITFERD